MTQHTSPRTMARQNLLVAAVNEALTRQLITLECEASRLDASHASLATLGISAETLKAWKAGYSNSGTNRGRLAIALHDRDGNILGFAGRSLSDEQPSLNHPQWNQTAGDNLRWRPRRAKHAVPRARRT
jgi:hypothetical protein